MMAARQKAIVYIDGFNLYFGMVEKGWRKYLWLDLGGFAQSLLLSGQRLVQVKYFTSRISGPPDKQARQTAIIDANQLNPGVQFFFGNYKQGFERCTLCGDVFECPRCRAKYSRMSEKKTDVNIAAQIISDAFLGNYDVATLVSADMDLLPALTVIKENCPGRFVTVAFPPKRYTAGLKHNAFTHMFVGETHLAMNQLPDPVVKPDGYQLRKPKSWV